MIFLNKFKYDQLVRKAAQLAGEEYQRSTPQSGSVDQRSGAAAPSMNP